MTAKVYKVLFLVHRQFGAQHYGGMDLEPAGPRPLRAHGAGSHPTGQVHPISLELLARYNYYPTARLRSKSWDEFAGRTRRRGISWSPSATGRRPRSARSGPANP